jgi:hypothetical protein
VTERRDPPVIQIGVAGLVLIVVSAIYQVSHLPRSVPLTLPWILVIAAFVLLAVAAASLRRVEGFAWRRFATVGQWVLVAYGVISGMIEYVFIRNDTRGGSLAVLTVSIVVFWLTVPLLIAYTVARYVPDD